MVIGFDLGNRYAKVFGEDYKDELFVAWREVSEEEYNSTEGVDGIAKVKYNSRFYLVGNVGNTGINMRNKGAIEVRDQSNFIKLVMISKYLKTLGKTDDLDCKIVTGTPYDDYDKTRHDYCSLMLSKDAELIELDGVEYKIKVTDIDVTKQGACVILTLPDRKSANYLIWDFGGETLDLSYFENGIRIKGKTIDFSLNRIFADLGKDLNQYIDVDRPSLLDARFQKSIENLILTGRYKNTTVIKIEDEVVELGNYVHSYLQERSDKVISDAINELDLNKTSLSNLINIFVGGGSKLLEKELLKNTLLNNKRIQEEPEFSNARAYYKIGKSRWM
ncbi:ParM/StbA family protein [Acetivibrio cellulolyticus]|uniref:ParM/StbA family protein n=1 Tax=Acetivibrio cellulolyticus TaxID=35830 RepID=UPI0001E2C798|nr:ParM/StbA family protein [Acetivibrio cellulolyticus]